MAAKKYLEYNFELFRSGDEEAFKPIFETFYKPLCYFALNLIKNPEESNDIVSDVMSRLWQRRSNFPNIESVKSFLYISTRNACLDLLKSRKIHDRVHSELKASPTDLDAFLNARILKVELIEYILQLIKSLPEQQKKVFQLYYFFDQSYEYIAQHLSITESTARWHNREAIRKLRGLLEKEENLVVFLLFVALMLSE